MGRLGFTVAISMAILVVAAMGMVATIAFGCLSFYFYLSTITSPALAALGVAVAALLFAIILTFVVSLIPRPGLLSLVLGDKELFGGLFDALSLGKALGGEGRDFLNSSLSRASIVAFGVGIAMGVSPRLRRAVIRLLLG